MHACAVESDIDRGLRRCPRNFLAHLVATPGGTGQEKNFATGYCKWLIFGESSLSTG